MWGIDKGDAHQNAQNHTHLVDAAMKQFDALLHWLNEWKYHAWKTIAADSDDRIRIYLGNEDVYCGKPGQPPQINRLTDDRLALLLAVLSGETHKLRSVQTTGGAVGQVTAHPDRQAVTQTDVHPDDIRLMQQGELLFYRNGRTGEVEVNQLSEFFQTPAAEQRQVELEMQRETKAGPVAAVAPEVAAVIQIAQVMVEHLGTQEGDRRLFAGDRYRIEREGDELRIFAQARGEILMGKATSC